MTSPIERLSSLVIGAVESVAPNEIYVLLELEAPHAVALNTGVPTPFPRLNSYVLIPNEAGATVAFISWLGIERSLYPKRSGFHDFGLIDLPFPLRKMKVVPLGTLTTKAESNGETTFELARGVVSFPSVGDQVLLPSAEQLKAIATGGEADRRIQIGIAPMSGGAAVCVDPDKLFGRHLAVLGNTGSGKSCSVAGLIRWSIEAARDAIGNPEQRPNARFIILDPNGEYARAFSDFPQARIFSPGDSDHPFVMPAWMWNSHEWSAVAGAQPGTQRPVLMRALRELRAGRKIREPIETKVVRQLRIFKGRLSSFITDPTGASYSGAFPARMSAGQALTNFAEIVRTYFDQVDEEQQTALEAAAEGVKEAAARRSFDYKGGLGYNDFTVLDFDPLLPLIDAAIATFPAVPEENTASEDAPIEFDVSLLASAVEDVSADGGGGNMANLVAYLTLRLRSTLGNTRLSGVVAPAVPVQLDTWLETHIGGSNAANGELAILDLSLLPADTLHIIVAALARIIFEASQRYCKKHAEGKPLPTVLVLEEAHTFVKRSREEDGTVVSPARLCREAFERIAREGRKFGVGLVLSSQRPSELSSTVLAQCNTFLLHRLVNDMDQDLVARLVPDNVGGLLRELASLPSRQAILLGWATAIPVMVEMRELSDGQRPRSDDPDFWAVWTGQSARPVDWQTIAREWTGLDEAGNDVEEDDP